MKKPSRYLGPAILLTLMPLMIHVDGQNVTWTWQSLPLIAAILFAAGAVFWALYLRARLLVRRSE